MKKLFLSLAMVSFLFSCKNEDSAVLENQDEPTATQRVCVSEELLAKRMAADPSLRQRMEAIEQHTAQAIANGRIVNGILEIPVVVNVLYTSTTSNISQSQIQTQIDVLNRDFQGTNSDYNSANAYNSVRGAYTDVRFVLDQIFRKSTTNTAWGTNDACKRTSSGGLAPTSPTTKLNLWVCSIGGGILGYAQFPGGSSSTDGVVIDYRYFGTNGTATAPFNLGRTATHEVGHWMNLRHIWGDATCGSDLVSDTPVHNAPNSGVPSSTHRSTCSGTPLEMWMNYMDYTDDRGMYMFSAGQVSRMRAVFAAGGSRASFR